MSRPSECVDCGTPMLPKRRGFPPPEGFVYHSSKGVCERCYSRNLRQRKKQAAMKSALDCAERRWLTFRCSTCRAATGQPCTDWSGRANTHKARRLAERDDFLESQGYEPLGKGIQ